MHIYDDPYAKAVAEKGLPKEALGAQIDEEMFQFGYPKTLDPNAFHIPPYTYETLTDGQMIDLGGRSLKVIHTPGHSADSITVSYTHLKSDRRRHGADQTEGQGEITKPSQAWSLCQLHDD